MTTDTPLPTEAKEKLAQFVADIEAGELFLEDLPEGLLMRFRSILSRPTPKASKSEVERVDCDNATDGQIERANAAVQANLNDDGSPRWDSAQGYACALTAIMQTDAALAQTRS